MGQERYYDDAAVEQVAADGNALGRQHLAPACRVERHDRHVQVSAAEVKDQDMPQPVDLARVGMCRCDRLLQKVDLIQPGQTTSAAHTRDGQGIALRSRSV